MLPVHWTGSGMGIPKCPWCAALGTEYEDDPAECFRCGLSLLVDEPLPESPRVSGDPMPNLVSDQPSIRPMWNQQNKPPFESECDALQKLQWSESPFRGIDRRPRYRS